MKRLSQRPGLRAALLTAAFLAGLLAGAFAVGYFPLRSKLDYLRTQTAAIADEAAEGKNDRIAAVIGPSRYVQLYDADGALTRYVPPTSNPELPPVDVARWLPVLLSGEKSTLVRLRMLDVQGRRVVAIVTGAPVRTGGAAFFSVIQYDLPGSIIGFACCFTLFYWLSVYLYFSISRKKARLEATRRSYVANVTHALKTPVASIKALAETLCEGVEPDRNVQKLYCGMILKEANRQDHMIRDILALSRLQSRAAVFHPAAVTAEELLDPVLEKYALLFDCAGVELTVAPETASLPTLHTDAACVSQILGVLMDNALKFVPEGGAVRLEAVVRRKKAVLTLRDNGVGIAAADLPHIFDRFYMGAQEGNENGSGLGLAIASELAAALGERLWAESTPGRGSAFHLTVALA